MQGTSVRGIGRTRIKKSQEKSRYNEEEMRRRNLKKREKKKIKQHIIMVERGSGCIVSNSDSTKNSEIN